MRYIVHIALDCRYILHDIDVDGFCFFFFSSRRRHTRYWRDWSSDVCSSDLFHITNKFANTIFLDETIDQDFAGNEKPTAMNSKITLTIKRQQLRTKPFIESFVIVLSLFFSSQLRQIGRASCRERVQISVVAVSLKKKKKQQHKQQKKKKNTLHTSPTLTREVD